VFLEAGWASPFEGAESVLARVDGQVPTKLLRSSTTKGALRHLGPLIESTVSATTEGLALCASIPFPAAHDEYGSVRAPTTRLVASALDLPLAATAGLRVPYECIATSAVQASSTTFVVALRDAYIGSQSVEEVSVRGIADAAVLSHFCNVLNRQLTRR
jgi:hypothetical protein